MGESYLVDVGQRNPVVVPHATSAMDAAFRARLMYPPKYPRTITVQDADGQVVRLDEKERKCRKCGCTENRACEGGCCWMAWDICSNCVESK